MAFTPMDRNDALGALLATQPPDPGYVGFYVFPIVEVPQQSGVIEVELADYGVPADHEISMVDDTENVKTIPLQTPIPYYTKDYKINVGLPYSTIKNLRKSVDGDARLLKKKTKMMDDKMQWLLRGYEQKAYNAVAACFSGSTDKTTVSDAAWDTTATSAPKIVKDIIKAMAAYKARNFKYPRKAVAPDPVVQVATYALGQIIQEATFEKLLQTDLAEAYQQLKVFGLNIKAASAGSKDGDIWAAKHFWLFDSDEDPVTDYKYTTLGWTGVYVDTIAQYDTFLPWVVRDKYDEITWEAEGITNFGITTINSNCIQRITIANAGDLVSLA